MAAGGSLISRLYDFLNGQKVYEYHLDNEYNRIHEWINGKIGNLNIATDADIDGSKLANGTIALVKLAVDIATQAELDAHKVSGDHDSRYFTETEVITMMANASLGVAPDRSIASIKLIADSITSAEIATGAVGSNELALGAVAASHLSFDPATQAELDAFTAQKGANSGLASLDAQGFTVQNSKLSKTLNTHRVMNY